MKTVFDPVIRTDLSNRISLLNETSARAWGKMTVSQMTKHCVIWNEWVLGKKGFTYKQEFLGKLFGKMALRSNTKDDNPISRNMPAGVFAVKYDTGSLDVNVSEWKRQIEAYENFSNDDFIHDFFGKMTREQIGVFVYKHNDHHLRQFNV